MPAQLIVDRAAAKRGSLIVMSTHGYTGINRWLIGSVAWKVVQAAQNPILLVRGDPEGTHRNAADELRRVIVPLDGSKLAEQVLPHVVALANKGYRKALMEDQYLRDGLNVHKGKITQREVARDLGYDYHPAEEVLRHD